MSEWQPIETAPKDGTAILVWTPPFTKGDQQFGGATVAKWAEYFSGGQWQALIAGYEAYDDSNFDGGDDYPTYWMSLPNPPTP